MIARASSIQSPRIGWSGPHRASLLIDPGSSAVRRAGGRENLASAAYAAARPRSYVCVSALMVFRVFYEATRDLDSQPPLRIDHVEACRPRGCMPIEYRYPAAHRPRRPKNIVRPGPRRRHWCHNQFRDGTSSSGGRDRCSRRRRRRHPCLLPSARPAVDWPPQPQPRQTWIKRRVAPRSPRSPRSCEVQVDPPTAPEGQAVDHGRHDGSVVGRRTGGSGASRSPRASWSCCSSTRWGT